jgi:predicted NUDIX family NTP pyrophosphohydrolase
MSRTSAGLLIFRRLGSGLEVLLVHPGGPFWRNKDEGAWSIPKGEADDAEDLLATARREFHEETGFQPDGQFLPLSPVRQKSGKTVHAWALQADLDTAAIRSNTFTMEWPPKSGKKAEFPEVDRAAFFDPQTARQKINPAQAPLIDELEAILARKHA